MDEPAFAFHDRRLQNDRAGLRQPSAKRLRLRIAELMEEFIQDGFDLVVEGRRGLHVDGPQGVHGGLVARDGLHRDDKQPHGVQGGGKRRLRLQKIQRLDWNIPRRDGIDGLDATEQRVVPCDEFQPQLVLADGLRMGDKRFAQLVGLNGLLRLLRLFVFRLLRFLRLFRLLRLFIFRRLFLCRFLFVFSDFRYDRRDRRRRGGRDRFLRNALLRLRRVEHQNRRDDSKNQRQDVDEELALHGRFLFSDVWPDSI